MPKNKKSADKPENQKSIKGGQDNTQIENESGNSDDVRPGNTAQMRQNAMGRRRFILDEIRAYGILAPDKLRERFPGVHAESLKLDLEFFHNLGLQIQPRKKDGAFYDAAASRNQENDGFAEQNIQEKHLVAGMLESLIIGFNKIELSLLRSGAESIPISLSGCVDEEYPVGIGASWFNKEIQENASRGSITESPQKHLEHLHPCVSILSAIQAQHLKSSDKRQIGDSVSANLVTKLMDYWGENIRMCMLDSGTTNELLALKLKELSHPYRNTNLSYFSVCTNNRSIFQILGDPTVPIRSIIIGGQQRGRTSTIAGALAEYFLRGAALLNFGICIVGATNIAIDVGSCFSDSQEEAIIKSIAFSKSNIKIVALDSSKLSRHSIRGGYVFSSLTDNSIDAIVTNVPLSMEYIQAETEAARNRHQRLIDEFWEMIDSIRARQVNVILASDERCVKRTH